MRRVKGATDRGLLILSTCQLANRSIQAWQWLGTGNSQHLSTRNLHENVPRRATDSGTRTGLGVAFHPLRHLAAVQALAERFLVESDLTGKRRKIGGRKAFAARPRTLEDRIGV